MSSLSRIKGCRACTIDGRIGIKLSLVVSSLIQATEVNKTYQSGALNVPALIDFSISIKAGQRVAVVGKSGSGKSTLLNLLAGLDRPTSGTLSVDGKRLDQMSRNQMAAYRAETIGIVFQAFQLLPQRTALQNVELPLLFSRVPRQQRHDLAEYWLERVGLADRMKHQPYALSGGERQRVAIARALIHKPRILLADEPTGNLDSKSARQIEALMTELCDERDVTFILVTHDSELAKRCGGRIIEMEDGKMMERQDAVA